MNGDSLSRAAEAGLGEVEGQQKRERLASFSVSASLAYKNLLAVSPTKK